MTSRCALPFSLHTCQGSGLCAAPVRVHGIFHLDGRGVTGRRGERAIRRPVTVDVNTLVSYVLDCDVVGSFFTVVGSDRHGFDGDSDGVACES